MPLDYILQNGVTIGFSSEAERDAYLGSPAGAGAQSQDDALAASPGSSITDLKNTYYDQHYGTGGAFEQQLLSGAADPAQARAYFDQGVITPRSSRRSCRPPRRGGRRRVRTSATTKASTTT